MIISEKICNSISVITLQGTLDASTASTLKTFKPALPASSPIVIDFSRVDFLDSSGLGALVGIAREKRSKGGEVTLACLNNKVRKVFEITQAYKLFDIFDDVEAATLHAEKKQGHL